jgi:hypothetical protein
VPGSRDMQLASIDGPSFRLGGFLPDLGPARAKRAGPFVVPTSARHAEAPAVVVGSPPDPWQRKSAIGRHRPRAALPQAALGAVLFHAKAALLTVRFSCVLPTVDLLGQRKTMEKSRLNLVAPGIVFRTVPAPGR